MNNNHSNERSQDNQDSPAQKQNPLADFSGFPGIKIPSFDSVRIGEVLSQQREQLRHAQSEYALGNFNQAREILESLTSKLEMIIPKIEPESLHKEQVVRLLAEGYVNSGRTYTRLGLEKEAIQVSRKAINLFAELGKIKKLSGEETNHFGIALYLAGDTELAVEKLREAAQLGSASAEAYFYLGLHAYKLHDFKQAEEYLNLASDLESDDLKIARLETLGIVLSSPEINKVYEAIQVFYELSELLMRLSRDKDALQVLNHILELEPGHLQTCISKSFLLMQIGENEAALKTLQDGLELNPNNSVLLASQGVALFQMRKYEEALSSFEQAEANGVNEFPDVEKFVLTYKGRALSELGRYEEAHAVLTQVISLDSNNSEALAQEALVLIYLGHFEESVKIAEQALNLTPGNTIVMGGKGVAQFYLGRYEEAIQTFDQMGSLDVPFVANLVLPYKGKALFELGRYEESVIFLDKALDLDPNNVELLTYKGRALHQLNQQENAIHVLDQALKLDPQNKEVAFHKFSVLLGLNQVEEALKTVEEALVFNPQSVRLVGGKGLALFFLRQYEEAVEAFDQAEKIGFADAPAAGTIIFPYKGKALFELNRYNEALSVLYQALNLNPQNPELLIYIGQSLYYLNKFNEAIHAYDQALEITPENAEALEKKGFALYQLGRYEEAVEVLDQAYQLEPHRHMAFALKGDAYRLMGKSSEGLETQEQILAKDPKNIFALTSKGYILIDLGRETEAIKVLDKALQLNNTYTWAMSAKAWALYRLDYFEKARNVIQAAVKLDPNSAWSTGLYGSILCDLADYKAAIRELKKAAKLDSRVNWVWGNLAESLILNAYHTQDARKKNKLLLDSIEAISRAIDLDESDLGAYIWLGDAHYLLGGDYMEKAKEFYQGVIEEAKKREGLDYSAAGAVGWSYFRLARYPGAKVDELLVEAERYLVESLALRKDRPTNFNILLTKFRLALVILASGRYPLGFREYENSRSLLMEKGADVQLGILDRAYIDLSETIKWNSALSAAPQTAKILKRLQPVENK